MDADLYRTFVSMVERGERNVTIATVEKLAKALKCRMADLMPDADWHQILCSEPHLARVLRRLIYWRTGSELLHSAAGRSVNIA
jgi:transcriptional regulator with XRE-family HTH domain